MNSLWNRTELRPELWCVSLAEPDRRVFGPVCFTENGVQYQTYLLDTGAGWALFGLMPERLAPQWLREIAAVAGDGVRWLFLPGTEDGCAAAKIVLEAYPEAALVGGMDSLFRLDGPWKKIEVRGTRTLTLGRKMLTCLAGPEWGGLYVLDRARRVLLTADAFGSAYASAHTLLSGLEDKTAYFRGAARYYMDHRSGAWAAAVRLVRENGVELICPARGPAVDVELERLLEIYAEKPPEKSENPTLAVVYTPGNCVEELARAIASGAEKSGPVTAVCIDLSAVDRDEVLRRLPGMDGYLFGTPEIDGDASKAVWDILTSLRREDCRGKPAAVFTSGNGGAAENLRPRLEQLGFDLRWSGYAASAYPAARERKRAERCGFAIGCGLQGLPAPQEAEDGAFRRDTENRYLILGGGVAAVSAAEAIRRIDRTGTITLLSAENHLPIDRTMLTKNFAAAKAGPESIQLHDPSWYEERGIQLRLGVSALEVRPDRKTVNASDETTYPYDKLIYATGAECYVPPFDGCGKPGVLTIRHLEDCEALHEYMSWARQAIVIGGGVLGLEAASELMRAGLKVTVLEATPQIAGRQVDAKSAAVLRGIMEKMGVTCYENVSVAGIQGEKRTTGVRLKDGRIFLTDLVVVSCGTQANVQTASRAGVLIDHGTILVNERMETNLPDIYACGDCCQVDGVNRQLWQEASEQGRVAGANAAGGREVFVDRPLPLRMEGFGTSLYAVGGPVIDTRCRTVEISDDVAGSYEKYWFSGGSLEGAVVIGAPEKTAGLSRAVCTRAGYSQMFAK